MTHEFVYKSPIVVGVHVSGNVRLLSLEDSHRLLQRGATLPALDDAGVSAVRKRRPIHSKVRPDEDLVARAVRYSRLCRSRQLEAPLLAGGVHELFRRKVELTAGIGVAPPRAEPDEGPVPLAVAALVEERRAVPHPRFGSVRGGRGEGVEVEDGRPLGLLALEGLERRSPPDPCEESVVG